MSETGTEVAVRPVTEQTGTSPDNDAVRTATNTEGTPTPATPEAQTGNTPGTESESGQDDQYKSFRQRVKEARERRKQERIANPRKELIKKVKLKAKETRAKIEDLQNRLAGDPQGFQEGLDKILAEGAGEINEAAEREKAMKRVDKQAQREEAKRERDLKWQKRQFNWFTLNFMVAPKRGVEALLRFGGNVGVYAYDVGAKLVESREVKGLNKAAAKGEAFEHKQHQEANVLEGILQILKERETQAALDQGLDPEKNKSERVEQLEHKIHELHASAKFQKDYAKELRTKAKGLKPGRYQIDYWRNPHKFKKQEAGGHH